MEWTLLNGLTPAQAREVLQLSRRRTFRRGEVVFHEGDPADCLHLVASGHVAVQVNTLLGDVATIRIIGPGEFFGELALISPGARNATVSAVEGCETLSIHRDQVDSLRRDSPAVESALLQSVVHEVRRLTAALVEAMYVPAPTRLARRLVELADSFPADSLGRVSIPLTQEELAGLCGTTRPTVNQLLAQLAERQLVELARGRVVVTNLAELRQRAIT